MRRRRSSTRVFLSLYAACLIAFLIVDAVWLVLMWPFYYEPRIGSMMAAEITWVAAIAFYVLFVAGLLILVIWPGYESGRPAGTLARAALFGLVAYGTYDLTNFATMKDWPLSVTLVDMLWGAGLSVVVSLVGLMVARRFEQRDRRW